MSLTHFNYKKQNNIDSENPTFWNIAIKGFECYDI